jgi:hypothetical protein
VRLRHLIRQPKVQKTDTAWLVSDLPPRHAPVYPRSRPIRAGWKWRSAQAHAENARFVLTVLCNPLRDNWQALLMVETSTGASVVARLESHGSHPGVHGHAHCDRGGIEVGALSIDNLVRTPTAARFHRRTNAWTEETFWNAAKRFFHVEDDIGPLFHHAR